ncbi:unnamed protein product [Peronospora belbahrii]|uniref:Uncharacterized protein n=1 Tax=Peronospora belbahrii TaxID=622444 RepID=A0AAU9KLY7_9STRA|nr:unnamed protein product [Peronospora belbahrii]
MNGISSVFRDHLVRDPESNIRESLADYYAGAHFLRYESCGQWKRVGDQLERGKAQKTSKKLFLKLLASFFVLGGSSTTMAEDNYLPTGTLDDDILRRSKGAVEARNRPSEGF